MKALKRRGFINHGSTLSATEPLMLPHKLKLYVEV